MTTTVKLVVKISNDTVLLSPRSWQPYSAGLSILNLMLLKAAQCRTGCNMFDGWFQVLPYCHSVVPGHIAQYLTIAQCLADGVLHSLVQSRFWQSACQSTARKQVSLPFQARRMHIKSTDVVLLPQTSIFLITR